MDHPALAAQILMNLNTSESCKNTPNVARKMDYHHHRVLGCHSAASSPLPQRRLDKLQGVINDKTTPLAIRRRIEEQDMCVVEPSPIVSRKFNQACLCVHTTTDAQFSAKLISGRRNTECACVGRITDGGDIMRRRVDSDCSCATSNNSKSLAKRAMCRSDITSKIGEPGVFSSPIHMSQAQSAIIFGSPAKSVIGEPSVFASPQKFAATDTEDDDSPLLTADQNIVSGWMKFRDNKKVSFCTHT